MGRALHEKLHQNEKFGIHSSRNVFYSKENMMIVLFGVIKRCMIYLNYHRTRDPMYPIFQIPLSIV